MRDVSAGMAATGAAAGLYLPDGPAPGEVVTRLLWPWERVWRQVQRFDDGTGVVDVPRGLTPDTVVDGLIHNGWFARAAGPMRVDVVAPGGSGLEFDDPLPMRLSAWAWGTDACSDSGCAWWELLSSERGWRRDGVAANAWNVGGPNGAGRWVWSINPPHSPPVADGKTGDFEDVPVQVTIAARRYLRDRAKLVMEGLEAGR